MSPLGFPQAQPLGGHGGGPATRLSVVGYNFVRPDGTLHIRKGITAFTLPKRAATGRKDDARRFMDWAAGKGLNEFRIFARVDWTGPPGAGVESGWQYDEDACAWVLEQAAARGCYVQVVANTGPFGNGADDCAKQLERVDALCRAHDNALLELWNEPQQNGGNDLVEAVLRRYAPRTQGWSTGVYEQTPYTPGGLAGHSMDYHSPRKSEWSRCFKDVFEFSTGQGPTILFSPGYTGAAMLSEPPQVEQTIRDAGHDDYWPDPAEDWRAYAAGSKVFGCGATIHGNPQFQQCEIPTDPKILACVDAFVAGFDDVPTQRYHGYNRTDPPSSNPGSRSYHRWGDDGREYVIRVRPYSFGPA